MTPVGQPHLPVPVPPTTFTHNLVYVVPQVFDAKCKIWQQRMRDAHKSQVVADGQYGLYSVGVCKAFQKYAGLPVTGVVNAATWAASFK
jgi:peptidoglycan hydrolase-like protein with peptidoglycan-binding domain